MKFVSITTLAARYDMTVPQLRGVIRHDPTFPKASAFSPSGPRWRLEDIEKWEVEKTGKVA